MWRRNRKKAGKGPYLHVVPASWETLQLDGVGEDPSTYQDSPHS